MLLLLLGSELGRPTSVANLKRIGKRLLLYWLLLWLLWLILLMKLLLLLLLLLLLKLELLLCLHGRCWLCGVLWW